MERTQSYQYFTSQFQTLRSFYSTLQSWIRRENDLEKNIERLSKEAHEAKLESTKSNEKFAQECAKNQEFSLKVNNMEKEKEVVLESHETLITETKTYYDNLVKDLEKKIQEIKEENIRFCDSGC